MHINFSWESMTSGKRSPRYNAGEATKHGGGVARISFAA